MHGLTGTWQLFKLGLKLDRIKLLVVISTLSFMLFLTVGEVHKTYGSDQAALTSYAAASAPSVVGRVFAGPLDGPYAGSVVLNEAYLFTAVAVAFMSTLAVVRHTRQNEEFGRSELGGSTVVSRHASLIAALLVAATANVVFGVVTVLAFWSSGLPLYGSILTGLAMMATGICFATIAVVAAQLTDSARGANALCALAIGIAFILRGVGDSLGTLVNNGLGVQSSFISWLSPLGWGQQLYPFTQQRVWVFALFIAISITCVSAAVALMNKRDIGLGTFPTRLGRSRAATSLLGVSGLTRKLQHTTLRGWAVAITVLGISFGLSIGEFQGLLAENDEFQQIFAQFGGDVTKAFLGLLVSFMTVAVAGYAAQALLRMRSEEAGGQLENVLGASVNRYRWMGSHILFVAAGVVMLSVLSALGIGVTYVLSTSAGWGEVGGLLLASLTQTAAIFAFFGFVVMMFAFWPRLAAPVVWGGFAACLLMLQLGLVLGLPQWVINISPFGHLPAMPAESFRLQPVVWLGLVSALLIGASLIRFRRRDIEV